MTRRFEKLGCGLLLVRALPLLLLLVRLGVGHFLEEGQEGLEGTYGWEDADRKGTRLQVDSNSESWDHTTYAHSS